MNRRRFLASVPGALLVAGCTGRPDSPSTATSTGSESPISSTPTDSTTARPQPTNVVLRPAFRYVYNDDAIGVDPPENDQFAFVLHPEYGADLHPNEFALELGDEEFSPRSSVPGFDLQVPGVGEAYTEDDRSGWLVFDVPTVEAEMGFLVADGTRHSLPEDTLPDFATAPDFTLRSVSTPDAVSATGHFDVTVEVGNDGDREGTFLAGIQRGGLFKTVEVSAAPGKTEENTVSLEVFAKDGKTEYLSFVHAGGHERYEVPVEEG